MFNPLEQFEPLRVVAGLPVRNSLTLAVRRGRLLIYTLLNAGSRYALVVVTGFFLLRRHYFVFVWHSVFARVGANFSHCAAYFRPLTLLLGVLNLLGRVPYTFVPTGQFFFVLLLSCLTFTSLTLLGGLGCGENFWATFLPNGTPLVIGPLVVCIELVSYLARLVSLTVRLFANVLSGHILVEIVAGFGVTFLIRWSRWGALLRLILTVIGALESCIGLVQAYVFGTLVLTYTEGAISAH